MSVQAECMWSHITAASACFFELLVVKHDLLINPDEFQLETFMIRYYVYALINVWFSLSYRTLFSVYKLDTFQ